ncbi:MAG: SAM-dependent methyltransferase [Clostridia bacterium]|nr:SAM-dependent methyltransferase [Clostridia bacterium]
MSEAPQAKITELIRLAIARESLKRIVFSKPIDRSIVKATASLKRIGSRVMLQTETFYRDGKARHVNTELADALHAFSEQIPNYKQINVLTTAGDAELRTAKSGTVTAIGADRVLRALTSDGAIKQAEVSSHDREKEYLLTGSEEFLVRLGVSDKAGRIYDKKRSKFRQINQFLRHVEEIESHLPAEGDLYILDLCCGKSYLSFAVYYYFAVLRQRKTEMVGVDRKSDVIEYCASVSRDVGFDGLTFHCMDISDYQPTRRPDLVISLHACDIATDIVLHKATDCGAGVILSTPCCHHELNHTLNCAELSFITRHSMLRQKLADAATDALRLLRLECEGYEVAALELIDPEDTPKNILLRAVRKAGFDPASPSAAASHRAFDEAKALLVGKAELHV